MAADARPSRPFRRAFGLVALVVASADLAAVASVSSSGSVGQATSAAAAARLPMGVYGALLALLGLWAVATSFARAGAGADADAGHAPDASGLVPASDEEHAVIHALRRAGWYVADDLELPYGNVDHIAVGPAGVIAMQVQWTNCPDGRDRPSVRARIAAQQLRRILAVQELRVEVVPAVLAFGPGLTTDGAGVKVVDTVAILNGYQADEWIAELEGRTLLPASLVDEVRNVLADLREDDGVVRADAEQPVLVH